MIVKKTRLGASGMGCFVSIIIVIIISIIVIFISKSPTSSQASKTKRTKKEPKISASLSEFKVDRKNQQFIFKLKIKNIESSKKIFYAVVYGKNDMFSPPRRSAWPAAGLLFNQAGTRRGNLSSYDISKNWVSKPEITKGVKIILKSKQEEIIEGALPINNTSQIEAWKGQPLDPRSIYNEINLWIFSDNGNCILKKEYKIN